MNPTTVAPAPRARRRAWPHPVLSLLLAASWVLLNRSVAPAHLLWALLLGWGVPHLLRPWLDAAGRVDWNAALRLTLVVLWDIVVANVTVARLTLGPLKRVRPAWVHVPLASDHARVNALLASIITMTPGTVSAVVDEAHRRLLVHALNTDDPAALVAEIKARYEAPLLRVFRVDPTGRDGTDDDSGSKP
ncbi:MAG: Na+/H+ antiporter subunit E [Tepidimonas ignava]|uniref:Multisubunit potassium/proton antiporter PhaE subunit n=1 Tax=Tepidimonas ignava TaxID=114249 RepID=A0A4V2UWG6_9BURK|nr:Na+/H+ antiporter subunit E [Tepidimonas ignava]TCS99547.1 multisubunit potassium/proton antiporter PhaE subunit [Tepidimonas ignava]TSE18615.1 Na(+)/H(+) antiporter subunit E [Tepidimonas ignava]